MTATESKSLRHRALGAAVELPMPADLSAQQALKGRMRHVLGAEVEPDGENVVIDGISFWLDFDGALVCWLPGFGHFRVASLRHLGLMLRRAGLDGDS